jgi:hypothetical protein
MKVTVAGYHCPVNTPDDELPEPDEVQTFEGEETVINAECIAFGVRFRWYKIVSEEK